MSGRLIVVSDAMYGSCGKGHVSAQLLNPDRVSGATVGVRVGGPNAGHIVHGRCPKWCGAAIGHVPAEGLWGSEPVDDHYFNGEFIGHPWKLRQVPVAAVANETARLVIAAGSEVSINTLNEELAALSSAGYRVAERLTVDSQATWLDHKHVLQERELGMTARLGSTAKGIGAARADRVMRTAKLWGQVVRGEADTAGLMYGALEDGATVLIEGTQGFGLGLHAGEYPYSTSGDCRAIDFLAQAGLSPWHPSVGEFEVWLACRTRPIRVAGNSGPMKGETSWGELGLKEERTTVTQKVRRVGAWDSELVRRAVQANGGSRVNLAVTMLDQQFPEVMGARGLRELSEGATEWLDERETETGARVRFVGTSPVTGVFI